MAITDGMTGIYLQIFHPKNLSNHLLPGLSAYGVPKALNTVFPFEYNDIEKFYKICKKK